MANSSKGAGNPLLPLGIVAAAVVVVIAGIFLFIDETPPDEPTVIAEDDIEARPAGAGTNPEGEADENMEGVTDAVDAVTPAAQGEDTIPAAEQGPAADVEGAPEIEGETTADEEVTGTVDSPVVNDGSDAGEGSPDGVSDSGSGAGEDGADLLPAGEAGTGGADGELGNEPPAAEIDQGADSDATEEFLLDEETTGGDAATIDTPVEGDAPDAPEGRDARTDLEPEEGQEIIRDTDDGGTPFIPTPSGPEGRDDNAATIE
ncbi:hypothetical protein E2L08_05595 [Palleronia sediminis]|uniref:Uncharacterized protein n=1 Tax=Palleronia sediminis TaxID=2547833 RepID=A0A4R6AC85_9RHOB|nr:hypothetical protein [Palleronia sediminis]TDL81591.1 hypothetical protein E2L08_05595 [Palleronia sediminis]